MLEQNRQLFRIASALQEKARELDLVPVVQPASAREERGEVAMFDRLITDVALSATTRQLFVDGHYAQSVEEGYKFLNNVVKSRSGLTLDGPTLMRTAFSPKGPRLKLSALKTVSQRDQQQGYMEILAGCMTGIRNPRAHEHRYLDESRMALELLVLANHLVSVVNSAKRGRKTRIESSTP